MTDDQILDQSLARGTGALAWPRKTRHERNE